MKNKQHKRIKKKLELDNGRERNERVDIMTKRKKIMKKGKGEKKVEMETGR